MVKAQYKLANNRGKNVKKAQLYVCKTKKIAWNSIKRTRRKNLEFMMVNLQKAAK